MAIHRGKGADADAAAAAAPRVTRDGLKYLSTQRYLKGNYAAKITKRFFKYHRRSVLTEQHQHPSKYSEYGRTDRPRTPLCNQSACSIGLGSTCKQREPRRSFTFCIFLARLAKNFGHSLNSCEFASMFDSYLHS